MCGASLAFAEIAFTNSELYNNFRSNKQMAQPIIPQPYTPTREQLIESPYPEIVHEVVEVCEPEKRPTGLRRVQGFVGAATIALTGLFHSAAVAQESPSTDPAPQEQVGPVSLYDQLVSSGATVESLYSREDLGRLSERFVAFTGGPRALYSDSMAIVTPVCLAPTTAYGAKTSSLTEASVSVLNPFRVPTIVRATAQYANGKKLSVPLNEIPYAFDPDYSYVETLKATPSNMITLDMNMTNIYAGSDANVTPASSVEVTFYDSKSQKPLIKKQLSLPALVNDMFNPLESGRCNIPDPKYSNPSFVLEKVDPVTKQVFSSNYLKIISGQKIGPTEIAKSYKQAVQAAKKKRLLHRRQKLPRALE
jgi:hypothetical protein